MNARTIAALSIIAVLLLAPLATAQTTLTLEERVAALETRVSVLEGTPLPPPSATPTTAPAPATATLTAIPPVPPTETPIPATIAPTVIVATPAPGQPCPTWLHDQITTIGPDGKLYLTWHPPVDPVSRCNFGHEHGDNPQTSKADSSLPAFGYIGQLVGDNEPHTGFKVFVHNAGDINPPDGRVQSHHSRMVFHMGTGGPRRFTVRHHSLEFDFVQVTADAAGPGHEVHVMGMADTGGVGSICASPRQGKTVVLLPGTCAIDSLYEIWAVVLPVGKATINASFALFDPNTIMDPADPSRLLFTEDYYPQFGRARGCNHHAYSGPVYYRNGSGPTTFRTDGYGRPDPDGPLVQYVSQHNDLGVKMTLDGQYQSLIVRSACAPGILKTN